MAIVVKALPRRSGSTPSRDMPKGLKQCWLENWTILETPELKLPLGISGNISGDPHVATGKLVSLYNLRRVQLHQGWVSTDTRLYMLGKRKEALDARQSSTQD